LWVYSAFGLFGFWFSAFGFFSFWFLQLLVYSAFGLFGFWFLQLGSTLVQLLVQLFGSTFVQLFSF